MSQITMKNISTANVVVAVPEINFRRELSPGRIVPLTRAQYDDLMFDPGFTTLVRGHYVAIYGVEEEKQVEQVSEVFDTIAISKMLDDQDVTAFAKFIVNAAPAEKETVVQMAVDKGITNGGITALIKKYCDVDVIRAINTKHQVEE